ncbi:DUF2845 domain-containing protein [Ramlibacter humi]|nr:DUF2845 domain-containing protein [Ramlibacter humi]
MGRAESLRCAGGSVAEGDSRLSLVYKCGQPDAADTFCAPVYYEGTGFIVPDPWASLAVPCQVVEQFVYDRGPGQLLATVHVRNGIVQSIAYGRAPR